MAVTINMEPSALVAMIRSLDGDFRAQAQLVQDYQEAVGKPLVSIAAIEVDWLQRLVTGDEAMKQISALMAGNK